MLARLPLPPRALPAGLLLAVGLLLGGWATAQRIDDGESFLNKKNNKEVRALRAELFKGMTQADPENKAHVDALDIGAKLVTYKYAWQLDLDKPGKRHAILADLESDLSTLANAKHRANNAVATRLFCQQVIERTREVFKRVQDDRDPRPITLINLALLTARLVERGVGQSDKEWADEALPRMQGGNAEKLAALLLDELKAPNNNDGVRYHALRGLANLLALPRQGPDLLKDSREKVVREALTVAEALNKRKFAASATARRKEGFKVLRREAVRVVATCPSPFLGDRHPALLLARVAGNDKSLNVGARLDERLEASLGLARMKATGPGAGGYNPEHAAEQIARLVRDFATEADRERELKGPERSRPWKVEAARLADALEVFRAGVKTDYAVQIARKAKGVLDQVEKGRPSGAADFADWLAQAIQGRTDKDPRARLYRDVEGSAIEERKDADAVKEKEPDN
jgi:hypothetical protein